MGELLIGVIPAIAALVGAGGIGAVISAAFKRSTDMKRIEVSGDDSLRADMMVEIGALRDELRVVRVELSDTQQRHQAHIEAMRTLYELELKVLRHQLKTEQQINTGLLDMGPYLPPERLAEYMGTLKQRREQELRVIEAEQVALIEARARFGETLGKLFIAKTDGEEA